MGVMDVDILEFLVPVENNKSLFVWNIEASLPEDQIYAQLLQVFSAFGPLFLLKLRPSAVTSDPSYSAILRFYSALQAATAQSATDGRTLFQQTPLKVILGSRRAPPCSHPSRALSHARCLELANHYLGFNGWTSDIIRLEELTNEEEEEEEELQVPGEQVGGGWQKRLRFGCILQLHFPQHQETSRGTAVVEEEFTWTGPEDRLQKRCQLQKRVKEKALVEAFSAVLLILLGNGKVMVEVKRKSDQFLPDPTEGILQVNECLWPEFDDEADAEDWDLTVT